MRATVFYAPGDVRVETVPDPKIQQPTDAIVRITHACICGSDLWFYRGEQEYQQGWRTGHELMGIVEEVGAEVQSLKRGDRVLAPFAISDGTGEFCHKGLQTSCVQGSFWAAEGNDSGQGEAVRAPFADATLVRIPSEVAGDDAMMTRILTLTDVMGTGHHAAVSAGVRPGGTVAVIGDGAVGLCGVLAARRLGAKRIIMLGRHADRLEIARCFGATDVVTSRDEQAVAEVKEMTNGGVESVLECVGAQAAMDTAIGIARPGGAIGYVGIPHGSEEAVDLSRMFMSNLTLRGGVAPVRAYIPELLKDVLADKLDPSPVLDLTVDLDGFPSGYAAMDGREAIMGAKVPGPKVRMGTVEMNFHYADYFGSAPSTGYETLIYDCMIGDATLFQRADNTEAGWSIVEPVLDAWDSLPPQNFPNYAAGTWGPKAADDLLECDGRQWRRIDG